MGWLKVDDWWEMLILGFVVIVVALILRGGLVVLGRALAALAAAIVRRGGKLKAAGIELSGEPTEGGCGPMQEEHVQILGKLTEAVDELRALARSQALKLDGLDRMQKAENDALDVLLAKASGEDVNGRMGKTRLGLAAAAGYKEAAEAASEGKT